MKQDVFEIEEALRNYNNEILNRVLYGMCENFPYHKSLEAVRAKYVIIGRTYASGAERHVIPVNGDLAEPLVNILFNSRRWLDKEITRMNAKYADHVPTFTNIEEIALLHGRLLTEFKNSTRDEHGIRSFVSKYLHFHAPVFPIYDSITKKVITRRAKEDFEGFYPWKPSWTHEFPCPAGADLEYWRFCVRIAMLRRDWDHRKFFPTARHLDICLLYWN
jgi:hypothetical protein